MGYLLATDAQKYWTKCKTYILSASINKGVDVLQPEVRIGEIESTNNDPPDDRKLMQILQNTVERVQKRNTLCNNTCSEDLITQEIT